MAKPLVVTIVASKEDGITTLTIPQAYIAIFGAGDEIRTHDIYLGKVTLYP